MNQYFFQHKIPKIIEFITIVERELICKGRMRGDTLQKIATDYKISIQKIGQEDSIDRFSKK